MAKLEFLKLLGLQKRYKVNNNNSLRVRISSTRNFCSINSYVPHGYRDRVVCDKFFKPLINGILKAVKFLWVSWLNCEKLWLYLGSQTVIRSSKNMSPNHFHKRQGFLWKIPIFQRDLVHGFQDMIIWLAHWPWLTYC